MRSPERGLLALIAGTSLVACAGSGQVRLETGVQPGNDTVDKGIAIARDLGYSVETVDRKAGLLVAEKQEGSVYAADAIQVLRVDVDDGEVTVTGRTEFFPVMGSGREEAEPSEIVKRDARTLRDRLRGVSDERSEDR